MDKEKDKYYIVSKNLIEKTLNEFGVKIKTKDVGHELETCAGTKDEHVSRIAGLIDFQIRLFRHALLLSLALAEKNHGVIVINSVREKATALINAEANSVIERYLEDEIKTRAEERSHD